jgi:hypothetical protein
MSWTPSLHSWVVQPITVRRPIHLLFNLAEIFTRLTRATSARRHLKILHLNALQIFLLQILQAQVFCTVGALAILFLSRKWDLQNPLLLLTS